MMMGSQDSDIVALFKQGLDEHNAGNLSAAKKMYHKILAIQPDHCEANHNIGIVLVAKNELDKALEFFKFALNASPNVSLFWASYIDTLAKLERIIEAKALIKAAKSSGIFCENIEAVSHRLDIKNQEPLEKDTLEIDEFITQKKFDDAIKACLNLLETYPSSAILNITLGKCYFELGQIDLAISSCTKATEYWPKSEASYALLGQIYSSQGDTEQAIKNLSKAVRLKPDDEGLNSLLMLELSQNGSAEDIIESWKLVLKINPNYAKGYFNLGNALNRKRELGAAIDSYKQALKINPDYAEAYNNMAYALKKQAKMEEAIEAYNKALTIKPDVAEVYNNMGLALVDYGQMEEAIEAYNKALSLNPNYAEAYNNMGNVLVGQGKLEEAIEACNKALSLNPDHAKAYNNMGLALTRQDKLEEAIEAFSKALSLKSDFAEAHSNMGNALVDQGKLEGAIKAYRKAIAIKPNHAEAYNNMSLVLLATQNFSQGFKLHEWRWKTKERDGTFLQSSKPLWNNEQGKSVFVWGEQGIGDEIMFAAMIPELRKLSSKIILRCDERLIPLFKRSFPSDIIFYSQGQSVAEDEYDFHIPIGSLANIFRTSLESFKETSAGFLSHNREKTSRLRDTILAGVEKKVIGISWKTKAELKGAGKRNIKLADLAQRLDHADIRLVCLQYGDVDDELKTLKRDLGIEIMQVAEIDNTNDIDGLASLIMACDQVVSTTNATVHLAGALGANTQVLLPFSTRWIWGSSGSDSFWYDTVSPYRQNNAGDWRNVLRDLA